MERKTSYTDLDTARCFAELLRDEAIPEEEIIKRLGEKIYKQLYPEEDSPRKSAKQILQEANAGGERYLQFYFSTLTRLKSGTTVDLAVARIVAADLITQGATEDEVRQQLGEEIWLLLHPPEKKKEKKEKKSVRGELRKLTKKLMRLK